MENGYPTMHYNNYYESSSSNGNGAGGAGGGGLRWHAGAPTVTSAVPPPPQQQHRAYMPAPSRATATKRAGSSNTEGTSTSNKKRGKSGSAAPVERTAARPAHWAKPDSLCGFCVQGPFQVSKDNKAMQAPGEELVSCWICGQSGAFV